MDSDLLAGFGTGSIVMSVLVGIALTVLPIAATVWGLIILIRIRRSIDLVLTRLDALTAQVEARR